MTTEEIIQAIRTIRYSSARERNARRGSSMNSLADRAGVTRKTIYEIAAGHTTEYGQPALDAVASALRPAP